MIRFVLLLVLTACGGNGAGLEFAALSDTEAIVGQSIEVPLLAPDASAGAEYSVDSNISDLAERSRIEKRATGAVFIWTPAARDVGRWQFTWRVADGRRVGSQVTEFRVVTTTASEGTPRFVAPLGAGTTLDLQSESCFEIDIDVQDDDSEQVDFSIKGPPIAGGVLSSRGSHQARYRWCPTPEQAARKSQYWINFQAKDEKHAPVTKSFLLVLRRGLEGSCPGEAPLVDFSPSDRTTVRAIEVDIDVVDDLGVQPPVVYYGVGQDQGFAIDKLFQIPTELSSGDPSTGVWRAEIPNPNVDLLPGDSASVHFYVSVEDNDDASGDCDHRTIAGPYEFTVEVPLVSDVAESCESCQADAQCGGDTDRCIWLPLVNGSFCADSCSSQSCASGYTCQLVSSVDGAFDEQCLPDDETCAAPCIADSYEDNDSMDEAPIIGIESLALTSCPAGATNDEDWFAISVQSDSQISVLIDGNGQADLDLELVDLNGNSVQLSESTTSFEYVDSCVPAGDYFIRVYSFSVGYSDYELLTDIASATCD